MLETNQAREVNEKNEQENNKREDIATLQKNPGELVNSFDKFLKKIDGKIDTKEEIQETIDFFKHDIDTALKTELLNLGFKEEDFVNDLSELVNMVNEIFSEALENHPIWPTQKIKDNFIKNRRKKINKIAKEVVGAHHSEVLREGFFATLETTNKAIQSTESSEISSEDRNKIFDNSRDKNLKNLFSGVLSADNLTQQRIIDDLRKEISNEKINRNCRIHALYKRITEDEYKKLPQYTQKNKDGTLKYYKIKEEVTHNIDKKALFNIFDAINDKIGKDDEAMLNVSGPEVTRSQFMTVLEEYNSKNNNSILDKIIIKYNSSTNQEDTSLAFSLEKKTHLNTSFKSELAADAINKQEDIIKRLEEKCKDLLDNNVHIESLAILGCASKQHSGYKSIYAPSDNVSCTRIGTDKEGDKTLSNNPELARDRALAVYNAILSKKGNINPKNVHIEYTVSGPGPDANADLFPEHQFVDLDIDFWKEEKIEGNDIVKINQEKTIDVLKVNYLNTKPNTKKRKGGFKLKGSLSLFKPKYKYKATRKGIVPCPHF